MTENAEFSYLCKFKKIMTMLRNALRNIFAVLMISAAAAVSCGKIGSEYETDAPNPWPGDRVPTAPASPVRAHLMVTVGFNNLSSFLAEDVLDLEDGFIPGNSAQDNLLFVFSHNTDGAYSIATSPVLSRLYKGSDGQIYRQKLIEFEKGSIPNTKESLSRVLNFIRDNYHPSGCGVLFSSHGTGWTPPGYCMKPELYEKGTEDSGFTMLSGDFSGGESPRERMPWNGLVPYFDTGATPLTKSFGQTIIPTDTSSSYETDIRELAEGIPFKLEYIIFDACFMGGVEVAYELKDKCRYICFSQTEILADGMNYRTMISHLLEGDAPDLQGLCREFFDYYNSKSGGDRSATISMVDCSGLDELASVCRGIFSRHQVSTTACIGASLQKYFYYSSHRWFYDLRSIVRAAGADESEISNLDNALSRCVLYKAATPVFAIYGFPITSHSGLSMYLPYPDRTYLNNYYRKLSWNKATELVK